MAVQSAEVDEEVMDVDDDDDDDDEDLDLFGDLSPEEQAAADEKKRVCMLLCMSYLEMTLVKLGWSRC